MAQVHWMHRQQLSQKRLQRPFDDEEPPALFYCPHRCCVVQNFTRATYVREHLEQDRIQSLHPYCTPECSQTVARKNLNFQAKRWPNAAKLFALDPKANSETRVPLPIPVPMAQLNQPSFERASIITGSESPTPTPTDFSRANAPPPLVPRKNRRNPAIWKNHRGLFAQYDLLKMNITHPLNDPQFCLALKELCNISDTAYLLLKRFGAINDWASFNSVSAKRKQLNSTIVSSTSIPDGHKLSVEETIRKDLRQRGVTIVSGPQHYKFALDGASLSSTPYHLFPIAIAMCKENYQSIKANFSGTFQELMKLEREGSIEVDGMVIPLDLTITMDMPLLLICLGYGKQYYNSKEYCCWRCKGKAGNRADLTHTTVDLRTLEDLCSDDPNRYYDVAITRKLLELSAAEVDAQVKHKVMSQGKTFSMSDRVASFWLTHVRARKLVKRFQMLTDVIELNWHKANYPATRPKFSELWKSSKPTLTHSQL